MTVEEFLARCLAEGWFFTHKWVTRKLREMEG